MRDSHALVGTRFAERYDIVRVLDEGGMGSVYVAQHAYTGQEVALKVLRTLERTSQMQRERFLREARAPGEIDHPGIVKMLDAGEGPEGELYLAMELLRGDNVHYRKEISGMDDRRCLEVGIAVLEILEIAHAKGLIHRDIKPANIFLHQEEDGSETVKLLDFGLIQSDPVSGFRTRTGAVMGTMTFMSPEQASGSPIDLRADLWSVGATLHHLFAGVPPFGDLNSNVGMAALLTQEPQSVAIYRADLNPLMVHAIDKSVRMRPADRWQSAAEMKTALHGALQSLHGGRVTPSLPHGQVEERVSGTEPTLISNAPERPSDLRYGTTGATPRTGSKQVWIALAIFALLGIIAGGAGLLFHLSETNDARPFGGPPAMPPPPGVAAPAVGPPAGPAPPVLVPAEESVVDGGPKIDGAVSETREEAPGAAEPTPVEPEVAEGPHTNAHRRRPRPVAQPDKPEATGAGMGATMTTQEDTSSSGGTAAEDNDDGTITGSFTNPNSIVARERTQCRTQCAAQRATCSREARESGSFTARTVLTCNSAQTACLSGCHPE